MFLDLSQLSDLSQLNELPSEDGTAGWLNVDGDWDRVMNGQLNNNLSLVNISRSRNSLWRQLRVEESWTVF